MFRGAAVGGGGAADRAADDRGVYAAQFYGGLEQFLMAAGDPADAGETDAADWPVEHDQPAGIPDEPGGADGGDAAVDPAGGGAVFRVTARLRGGTGEWGSQGLRPVKNPSRNRLSY